MLGVWMPRAAVAEAAEEEEDEDEDVQMSGRAETHSSVGSGLGDCGWCWTVEFVDGVVLWASVLFGSGLGAAGSSPSSASSPSISDSAPVSACNVETRPGSSGVIVRNKSANTLIRPRNSISFNSLPENRA